MGKTLAALSKNSFKFLFLFFISRVSTQIPEPLLLSDHTTVAYPWIRKLRLELCAELKENVISVQNPDPGQEEGLKQTNCFSVKVNRKSEFLFKTAKLKH